MKEGWPKKTLGEICGFVRGPFGGSLTKSVFVAEGFAVYEQQHAIYDRFEDIRYFVNDAKFKEMQRFELRPNDLIMSCSGTMGRVAIVPENIRRGIINQALLKLTPSKAVSPEFLKYWMDSNHFQDSLKEQSGGAAIQNVASVGILKEIQISLPSLREQRRIVGILDEAFDDIATARANAEKNLQNARAVFESHLASVFAQRGNGWAEEPIGGVAKVFDGPHATPKTVDAGPVFLGISALQDGKINLGETRHVTPEDFERWTRRVTPRADDVVFSYETRLGQAAIIPRDLQCCLGRRMGLVRVNRKRLDPRFFVYQYISAPFREYLAGRTVRGATVDRIPLKEFPTFPISLPRLEEQVRMAEQFETLREETERLGSIYERKLAALDALKKSVLHQAFTGEL